MTKGAPRRKRPAKNGKRMPSAPACRTAVTVLAAEVAVPGADGRPLGDGPLLRGLPAGADDAPHIVPASRRAHGFQMDVDAAAGEAGAYGMGVQFFHGRDCISRAREGQAGNAPMSRKFFVFLPDKIFFDVLTPC